MNARRQRVSQTGFTLIELLVVISIIALLISILLPALQKARTSAQKIKSAANLRSIHQGLVLFAEQNDGYYTGYSPSKAAEDGSSDPWRWFGSPSNHWSMRVETRFAQLLPGQFLAPNILLNPADPVQDKEPYSMGEYDPDNPGAGERFTTQHYSYALDEIGAPWTKKRHNLAEWQNNMNSQSVVAGDRLLNPLPSDWTDPSTYTTMYGGNSADFSVGVVFNDGHTEFSGDAYFQTEYDGFTNSNDFIYLRKADVLDNEQSPEASTNWANAALVASSFWRRGH
jgi:prepilin-type N-terminal cleavage/methylation domain-containing protein